MPLKLLVALAAAAAATCVYAQQREQPQFTGLRGANTWYNFLGPSNESDTLLAVTYLHENLVQYGYNIYTLDEGWAENGKLLIDGNGLPEWNPSLYPSGLPSLASRMKQMGVGLGVWLMRGIPREAVENKLPIANSSFTCDQAVRMDGNCSWNSHTFATNGSPAAAAYYASLANKLVSWGITLVKMDCLWPHLYEGTPQPFFNEDVEGASTAFKAAGLILSMSPGISVSPFNASYIAAGSRAALYRIAEGRAPKVHKGPGV
jgi:alpha-galactosidase